MNGRRVIIGSASAVSVFLLAAAQPAIAEIHLSLIGRYTTGVYDEGAAEITAFDKTTDRLFVVNANGATVDIVNLEDPANPALLSSLDIQALFGNANFTASPNSVAVQGGLVAVAVERLNKRGEQKNGVAALFDGNGTLLASAEAGALPDMVTFTPDGSRVLLANDGEPNADYTYDPQGSVTLIDVAGLRTSGRLVPGDVKQITFGRFNNQLSELRAAGVRLYGPGASVAQDLEPEYIAVSPDSRFAYVTLQENNAVAVVDIAGAEVVAIHPLGFKDWTQSGLDASDRDDAITLQPWPVFGMYEPDGIASYRVGLHTYLVTANEGDARDYDTFGEEARVSSLNLDPVAFPNATDLRRNAALGRLNVTTTLGNPDGDDDFDQLFTLGGRSFSIWKVNADGSLSQTFDSADQFEQITASLQPAVFNSDNAENGSFDTRSDNKGPEPEGVTLGEVDGCTYAFIGLERVGGVMVYDISNPEAPQFVQYVNSRDFQGDAEAGTAGDLGPEGLDFVPAADSPTGNPLLIVAHEISGSVAIFQID